MSNSKIIGIVCGISVVTLLALGICYLVFSKNNQEQKQPSKTNKTPTATTELSESEKYMMAIKNGLKLLDDDKARMFIAGLNVFKLISEEDFDEIITDILKETEIDKSKFKEEFLEDKGKIEEFLKLDTEEKIKEKSDYMIVQFVLDIINECSELDTLNKESDPYKKIISRIIEDNAAEKNVYTKIIPKYNANIVEIVVSNISVLYYNVPDPESSSSSVIIDPPKPNDPLDSDIIEESSNESSSETRDQSATDITDEKTPKHKSKNQKPFNISPNSADTQNDSNYHTDSDVRNKVKKPSKNIKKSKNIPGVDDQLNKKKSKKTEIITDETSNGSDFSLDQSLKTSTPKTSPKDADKKTVDNPTSLTEDEGGEHSILDDETSIKESLGDIEDNPIEETNKNNTDGNSSSRSWWPFKWFKWW